MTEPDVSHGTRHGTRAALWTTPVRGSELHGEDLGMRRPRASTAGSSSTAVHRREDPRPHPLCTPIERGDLRERLLSTDSTLPTTTAYLYVGRSTVELHQRPDLWNTARHGRIRKTPAPALPTTPTTQPAKDPQS